MLTGVLLKLKLAKTVPRGERSVALTLIVTAPPVLVFLRSPTANGSRVVVATPCVRFEAVVPSSAVLPVLDMELPDHATARLPRRIVRAGVALRWPDGAPAGRTTAAVPLSDDGRLVGAMRCVHIPLRVSDAPEEPIETEVCADAQDVSEAQ